MDRPRRVMAALNIGTALLLLGCIWVALPVRWAPVDVLGSLLALLLLAAGGALWRGQKGSRKLGLWAAAIVLLTGALLGTALIVTAGTLAGLYGPVGGGGALILGAAFFMLVPYLVVFPASQLYFLFGEERGPQTDLARNEVNGVNNPAANTDAEESAVPEKTKADPEDTTNVADDDDGPEAA